MRNWLRAALIVGVAIALLAAPSVLRTAPPVALDGGELPTLAPVLKRVTPAVVNIYTKRVIRLCERCLTHDDDRDPMTGRHAMVATGFGPSASPPFAIVLFPPASALPIRWASSDRIDPGLIAITFSSSSFIHSSYGEKAS